MASILAHDTSFETTLPIQEASQDPAQHAYDQEWERQMKDSESIAIDLEKYGEDELIVEALRIGAGDLYSYTQKVESDLRRAETESIEDYVRQSTGVAELRMYVEDCDKRLTVFDDMLQEFQQDLGKVGNQIKEMNERARSFDILAANRKGAEANLSKFIDGVAIPKGLLKAIHEDPVTPEFASKLETLEHKLRYLESEQAQTQATTISHVKPVLERLKVKAVERVKEHAVSKLRGISSDPSSFLPSYLSQVPETEQMIQEKAAELTSMGPMIAFLHSNDPAAYAEVQAKYVELMGAALMYQTRGLIRESQRFQVEVFRSTDTLIDKESGKGAMRAMLSKATATASQLRSKLEQKNEAVTEREDPFELRERLTILNDLPKVGLITTKTVEASFKVLMTFLIGSIKGQGIIARSLLPSVPSYFLSRVLLPALQVIEESFSQQIRWSQDPIAMLLMARIVEETRDEAVRLQSLGLQEESGELSLESFFQRMSMAVWPIFKTAVEVQVDSLKKAEVSSFLAFSGTEGRVHLASRRFASLSAALHAVNSGLGAQPAIMGSRSLDYLRIEFERFCKRIGEALGAQKKQLIFSVNQYFHVLSAYHDYGVPAAGCAPIRRILESATATYVGGLLKDSFPILEAFGTKIEEAEAKESFAMVDEKEAKRVLDEFTKDWKKGLNTMKDSLKGVIADKQNCSTMFKKAATRVLLNYLKLREIIQGQYPGLANALVAEEDVIGLISGYEGDGRAEPQSPTPTTQPSTSEGPSPRT